MCNVYVNEQSGANTPLEYLQFPRVLHVWMMMAILPSVDCRASASAYTQLPAFLEPPSGLAATVMPLILGWLCCWCITVARRRQGLCCLLTPLCLVPPVFDACLEVGGRRTVLPGCWRSPPCGGSLSHKDSFQNCGGLISLGLFALVCYPAYTHSYCDLVWFNWFSIYMPIVRSAI